MLEATLEDVLVLRPLVFAGACVVIDSGFCFAERHTDDELDFVGLDDVGEGLADRDEIVRLMLKSEVDLRADVIYVALGRAPGVNVCAVAADVVDVARGADAEYHIGVDRLCHLPESRNEQVEVFLAEVFNRFLASVCLVFLVSRRVEGCIGGGVEVVVHVQTVYVVIEKNFACAVDDKAADFLVSGIEIVV